MHLLNINHAKLLRNKDCTDVTKKKDWTDALT